jgi:uncharacterized protein YjbI with pentapeptide repeats
MQHLRQHQRMFVNGQHCRLVHVDPTSSCLKRGNPEGPDFEGAKLVPTCVSYGDYRSASFRGANLSGANLAHARLDGADLTGARFIILSIKGTHLRPANGLTQAQVGQACADAETRLTAPLRV